MTGTPPPTRPRLGITPAPGAAATPPVPASPVPSAHAPWRLGRLLAAPHRLGFFLAMTVLVLASGWWLLVQADRASGVLGMAPAVPATLTHAAVMVMGFMPLFFAGFLFTAGPKWLNVPPYEASRLLPALLLQAAGWVLWLVGAHLHLALAVAGLALATAGLGWMYALFWRLIHASRVPDRVHAKAVGMGGVLGTLCLVGTALALAGGQVDVALALVRTALKKAAK